jgi:hypothetical protein
MEAHGLCATFAVGVRCNAFAFSGFMPFEAQRRA